MTSSSPSPDSEVRLDDDPHMAHDWIFNPKATAICPNNNSLIEFAGRQWWTNYHWSTETGPYVWGGSGPVPNFGTVFDPKLATLYDPTELKLAIDRPNDKYDSWRTQLQQPDDFRPQPPNVPVVRRASVARSV